MKGRVLALGLLTLAACGYRFTAGRVPFPEGVRRVRVSPLGNRSAEPGLEVRFTQALREQLARSGTLAESEADAVITGEILSTSDRESIARPGGGLTSYRLTITSVVRLVQKERVLSEAFVSGEEDFLAADDPLRTEANRAAALQRLADSLMREGVDRLATGF
jgi:hypothetical protein